MSKRMRGPAVLQWSVSLLIAASVLTLAPAGEEPAPSITGEEAILAALEQKVTIRFIDEPLGSVVEYLKSEYRIETQIDARALANENIGSDTPITMAVANVKLRSALNLLLRDLDLAWIIVDEVLMITTQEEAEQHLSTGVYDLGTLVTVYSTNGRPWQDFDSITKVLTWTVDPESWEDMGGAGTVRPMEYRGAKVLVVRQTREVHQQITQLLAELTAIADKYGDNAFPTAEPKPAREEMPRWQKWSGSAESSSALAEEEKSQ